MKIYTKKGDGGQTSLIGGTRVAKSHQRIEAYGTIDELNSYIGWVRDLTTNHHHRELLLEIQDRLFTIGSLLAADPEKSRMTLPGLTEADCLLLENEMDQMDADLPEMKNFILPGGAPAISCCHVARCVCRRAERNTVLLSESAPVDPQIIKYLNRLSDFLFVLCRYLHQEKSISENPWKPRV